MTLLDIQDHALAGFNGIWAKGHGKIKVDVYEAPAGPRPTARSFVDFFRRMI
ncbi:hypothetical protein FA15DRAFT_664534 [Coprinopsis marcescibilis]|uniref:Uncharacterized protein n=1 Tax=Coprinopsis marcescibilis TaxID=230819 RepID=A0A5C3L8X2_COPMA|nr:hypothetical protein FA15DRAFT_664534 [Coprinopsis marcescibilis]